MTRKEQVWEQRIDAPSCIPQRNDVNSGKPASLLHPKRLTVELRYHGHQRTMRI